jgi:hypothetical protein
VKERLGARALEAVVASGDIRLLTWFLNIITLQDVDGGTALLTAAGYSNHELCEALVKSPKLWFNHRNVNNALNQALLCNKLDNCRIIWKMFRRWDHRLWSFVRSDYYRAFETTTFNTNNQEASYWLLSLPEVHIVDCVRNARIKHRSTSIIETRLVYLLWCMRHLALVCDIQSLIINLCFDHGTNCFINMLGNSPCPSEQPSPAFSFG